MRIPFHPNGLRFKEGIAGSSMPALHHVEVEQLWEQLDWAISMTIKAKRFPF